MIRLKYILASVALILFSSALIVKPSPSAFSSWRVGDRIVAAYFSPYTETLLVHLQNSGFWRKHTFHLTDAYFGGRQNEGADLTLTDLAWADGKSNYFGRVWIAKSASLNRVPDLIVPNRAMAILDQLVEIPISATDADGQPITLKLDRGVDFATLLDYGDGRGMLRLALSEADVHPCLYRVRLLATDSGNPPLSDAATIELTLGRYPIFLPFLSRSW